MKKNIVKIGLILAVFAMVLLYNHFDKVVKSDQVTIQNIDVKTKDLGSVSLVDGNLDYDIVFNQVGDEFVFSFDIVNDTMFDMKLKDIEMTGISENLDYRLYDNNDDVIKNTIIKKNNKKTVFIAIKYVKDSVNEIGNNNLGFNMTISRV